MMTSVFCPMGIFITSLLPGRNSVPLLLPKPLRNNISEMPQQIQTLPSDMILHETTALCVSNSSESMNKQNVSNRLD